jgi:hypothetical protein
MEGLDLAGVGLASGLELADVGVGLTLEAAGVAVLPSNPNIEGVGLIGAARMTLMVITVVGVVEGIVSVRITVRVNTAVGV